MHAGVEAVTQSSLNIINEIGDVVSTGFRRLRLAIALLVAGVTEQDDLLNRSNAQALRNDPLGQGIHRLWAVQ